MIILYPTETIYGLGVNVFDAEALKRLFELKGRDESKTASWLVRNIEDIETYAILPPVAARIAEEFLPGELTLVLEARETVPEARSAPDNTVGIRVSSDPVAQRLIKEYMDTHRVPLTCTSANVSGMTPCSTPKEILKQFGEKAKLIDRVIDDGPRTGVPSTVVRAVGNEVEVLREGAIPAEDIYSMI